MRSNRLLSALVVSWMAVAGCRTPPPPAETKPDPLARGKYLVEVLACNDCHTPFKMGPNGPEPDMTRMLSGHPATVVLPPPPKLEGPWVMAGSDTNTAFAGPWGITYAINLTPDENTGIGVWDEETFVGVFRTGQHWLKTRPILPPMPVNWYGKLPDEDIKAMYAYLRTIPKVDNKVPEYQPPQAPDATDRK